MRAAAMLAAILLAAPTGAAEVATPEALLDRHVEAFNLGDPKALASLYAPDGKIFTPEGRAIRGKTEIERYFDLEQKRQRRQIRLIPSERETSAGIAYIIGSYTISRPNERGTFTMCFKRGADGSWKIVASMWNKDAWTGYTPLG